MSINQTDMVELQKALVESPRRIPSKYFYDERGSALFEQITEQPEYYLTQTERSLLETIADEIALLTGAEELVELGSGSASKTRILLDAMARQERLRLYVPFDVSETEVKRVAEELSIEYPDLEIHGVVADFTHHMEAIPPGDPRLVILLGSTIGNFQTEDAVALLRRVSEQMSRGDFFLLGIDLIKDIERLEAAYTDAAGVTEEFNRNILRVINRIAGADFRPEAFRHKAFFNREQSWIEIRLVAEVAQKVRLEALDLTLEIAQGEELLTEISSKYDRPTVQDILVRGDFELVDWYTDPEELFALALARKNGAG